MMPACVAAIVMVGELAAPILPTPPAVVERLAEAEVEHLHLTVRRHHDVAGFQDRDE
jgi:hypothetical protein